MNIKPKLRNKPRGKKFYEMLEKHGLYLINDSFSSSHVIVGCKKHKHHIFLASITSITSHNIGCKYCSGKKLHPLDMINRVKEICDSNNLMYISLIKYNKSKTIFRLKCKKDSYIFDMVYNCLQQGQRCPKCSNKVELTNEEWRQRANNINLDILSYELKNNCFLVKCKKCGNIFYKNKHSFINKTKGCIKCSLNILSQQERWEIANSKAKQLNYELLWKPEDFTTVKRKYPIKCLKHNFIWDSTYDSFINGNKGCPICKTSSMEKSTIMWLKDNNIKFEYQKKFNNLFGMGGKQLSYDFYIPSNNLLIECQGEQHYHKFRWEKDDNDLKIRQKHDELKRKYVQQNKIHLLEIKYDENIIDKLREVLVHG